MKLKLALILFLAPLLSNTLTRIPDNKSIKLLTTKTDFVAGSNVTLIFSTYNSIEPLLYLNHSYGATVIKPCRYNNNKLKYKLPIHISSKAGIITWQLLVKDKPIHGNIKILAQQKTGTIETYLGPPSIVAGGRDYSMHIVIPTDNYDNTLKDGTEIKAKYQFLDKINITPIYIKNGISYKNIFSTTKTGRILASSNCLNKNSKEYTINVTPAIPTDFKIEYKHNHNYADGNQITTFLTNTIKDKYGNVVSDGTYVEFFIKNTAGAILKTFGTTIKGIATAKMIHPDHKDHWEIQAFIEGMAISNKIKIAYKNVISDFEINFLNNQRTIKVGPLKSFMNQIIPDGLEVSLTVYKNDMILKTISKESFEGYAIFNLDINNFPSDTYTIKVKAYGLEKTKTNKIP